MSGKETLLYTPRVPNTRALSRSYHELPATISSQKEKPSYGYADPEKDHTYAWARPGLNLPEGTETCNELLKLKAQRKEVETDAMKLRRRIMRLQQQEQAAQQKIIAAKRAENVVRRIRDRQIEDERAKENTVRVFAAPVKPDVKLLREQERMRKTAFQKYLKDVERMKRFYTNLRNP